MLVPNMKSLAVRLLAAKYRYVYPQHLNYFTEKTLRKLVESLFAVVEMRSTHFNPLVIWQDWHSGGAEVANRERAELLKRTTAYKQMPLLKPLKAVYRLAEAGLRTLMLGDNLAAALRKK